MLKNTEVDKIAKRVGESWPKYKLSCVVRNGIGITLFCLIGMILVPAMSQGQNVPNPIEKPNSYYQSVQPLPVTQGQRAGIVANGGYQNPGATVPKVDRYYDPNENRYVRVAYQADGAILPAGSTEMQLANFGGPTGTQTSAGTKSPEKALDVVVYPCPANTVAAVEARLRTEFAKVPEITIATDYQSGKILVHTTRIRQEEVTRFMATLGIHPFSPAIEQYDSRTTDGTVRPITGRETSSNTAPVATPAPTIQPFIPKLRTVQEMEKLVTTLFGDRIVAVPIANSANATGNSNLKVWRFTGRKLQSGEAVRTCEIQFDSNRRTIQVRGDTALCRQMEQLLAAMDRETPQNGNVRRFISIRQSDSRKIKEILEYYNTPGRKNTVPGSGGSVMGTPLSQLLPLPIFHRKDRVTIKGQMKSPHFETINPKESSNTVRPIGSVFQGKKGESPQNYTPIPDSTVKANGPKGQPVRLTGYQGEVAAPAGGVEPLSAGNAGLAAFDPNAPANHGLGVVPDYMPQVLPDLDVVIIDAPEAEYKKIENMIREIEELAKLAEPKIEIYNLKHVNCVMLQGILQQLHQEMFVTKQGRVIIFAMQYPNAILVVGWGQAFTAMKDLINVFDQPIDNVTGTIRVIRLKYAAATEMALQLTAYFPSPQPVAGGMAPRIRVFPDVRTNSLVVHAAPNDMLRVQQILTELDVNKSAPRLQVKTFPLKNLLAEDMRRTIMTAILPSVQGTQDNSTAKYPILEILSVDAQSKRLIESGIMTDVNIAADVHNNQLIVTAPEDCMELLEKLIHLLDVAPAKAQIKIFRIVFGDATELSKTLQSLLPTGGGSMPAVPNAEGEESFVPVRFAIDTRTNCIIAAAAPRDLKIIEALILSLDRKDVMERKEVVIPLRNVQALAIAKAIDDYLSRKQNLEIASEAMSVYQMFESQVIVVPESITNSLIISATPQYLDEIKKLVESFDTDPPQVVIQVLIAEVNLNDQEEFGIEAGWQDTVAFDRSLVTSTTNGINSATGNPGFDLLGNNSQGNNMLSSANQSTVAGQVLNTLGMGRTSDLGYGGLVLSASSRNVQVTLRALRDKNRLQILSRPQITAMDNQQAFILVGQRVPRIQTANMTNYGVSSSVTDANVGLILLVTPRISKEGRVIMEIGAEKSALAGVEDSIPVFSSDGEVIKSPSIDTIQAMTAVSAMDGETVMLGGLITTTKQKKSRGVPCLSDIPVLGWLFRYDQEIEQRKELLIVMTPRIVRNSADLENIKRVEASKMTWCLADAMALNGSMGLFDPLSGQSGQHKPQTKLLPFLEMDKMDELSKTPQYSPETDYETKTGVVNSPSEQLPDDILRKVQKTP